MDNYFAAKRRLFIDGRSAHTVINLDDGYGARLAREPELDRP
jgi:UDP-N-acetylmuramyl tripeptide synthase